MINHEDITLLQCRRLPARLSSAQVGAVLGFSCCDVTVLMSRKLLKPLGRPAQNSTKYFATIEIEALTSDRDWLGRATQLLQTHWRAKNINRSRPEKQNSDSYQS